MKKPIETGYDRMQRQLEKPTKESKFKRLREYLKPGVKITPLEALRMFGIYRLGARIHDLRHKHGWAIKTEKSPALGEEFAVYHVIHQGKKK